MSKLSANGSGNGAAAPAGGELAGLIAEFEAAKAQLAKAEQFVVDARHAQELAKQGFKAAAERVRDALGFTKQGAKVGEAGELQPLRGDGFRKVLECLDENGTMASASAIAKELEMSVTGMPHLLKKMVERGMVEKLKSGQWALTERQQREMRADAQ